MTSSQKLVKVLIADDEESARKSIQMLLKKDPEVEICAECSDGHEAAEEIIRLKPDLVFLDIQMPELDGFEVIEKICNTYLPVIVFVTAFDQYAIKAFEQSALDYLLKPFTDARFYAGLEKAKRAVEVNNVQKKVQNIESLLTFLQSSSLPKTGIYQNRLTIKTNGKITFVPVNQILFVESEGNFVKIHSESGTKIGGYTFKTLIPLLNPAQFVRIHKSFIVNIDAIESLEPHFHGDYIIHLKNGQKLRLSRNYNECLKQIMN